MLKIVCPVCKNGVGRALGITNVLIKCKKCKTYYLFVSDSQGRSTTQIIKDKQEILEDKY